MKCIQVVPKKLRIQLHCKTQIKIKIPYVLNMKEPAKLFYNKL